MRLIAIRAGSWVVAVAMVMPAWACVNTFESDLAGLDPSKDKASIERILARLDADHVKAPTVENSNDRAVARMIVGRNVEAIALLRDVEKSYPGKAVVAANLGTALELAGQDEEALKWIREGIRRDPGEHMGTEWVHAKILEAKLELARNPEWLRQHAVIGWRPGDVMPVDESGRPRTYEILTDAIRYQLNERVKFVAPPDAIVGDLFLSLADLTHSTPQGFNDEITRLALESSNYESALEFGTVHEARVREALDAANQAIEASFAKLSLADAQSPPVQRAATPAEKRSPGQRAMWLYGGLAAAVVLGFFLYWRRNARARASR